MVLEVKNVSKIIDKQLILRDINLSLTEGKIIALLGPNGAGKTSLVKSILDLFKVSKESQIKIDGADWLNHISRDQVAYLPEKFNFYPSYRIKDVLNFYFNMYNIQTNIADTIEQILFKVSLDKHKNKKVSQLSKGQMQRLGIACCMIPNRKIIILDEPFSGLDPFGIKELKEYIHEWKKEGKTIFINTHLIGEITSFVEEVIILNEGIVCECINMLNTDIKLDQYFFNLIKEKRNESI